MQALVLMNDEQHVEAARSLAEQLVAQFPKPIPTAIAREAFLRVVGRPPTDADTGDLVELAKFAGQQYQIHPEEARKLISIGELPNDESLDSVAVASWTVVVNALLNRDDVITQN